MSEKSCPILYSIFFILLDESEIPANTLKKLSSQLDWKKITGGVSIIMLTAVWRIPALKSYLLYKLDKTSWTYSIIFKLKIVKN